MPSLRRWCVVLFCAGLLALLALSPPALAQRHQLPPATPQPREPGKDGQAEENPPVIQLPVDARRQKKLDAAADYLKEESWTVAVRLLQAQLDAKEDAFVAVPDKAGGGAQTSAWTEANRLLATLPPKGREQYEQLYGEAAAALLKEGKEKQDSALLAVAARRFLFTRAGGEALRLLASHHLTAGNVAMAANSFARLLERQPPAEWTAETLYDATRAFRRAGDQEHAAGTWKLLQGKAEQGKLRLGDRTRTLAEWEADLDKVAPPAPEGKDWPIYRRDPARSNEGSGDKPFLEKQRSAPSIKEAQTRGLVEQAVKLSEARGQPVLPAFFPVAADGKVIYRDYWGVRVRDLLSGKVFWDSDSRYGPDCLFDQKDAPSRGTYVHNWASSYLGQMGKPGMLFENSVVGTLSTDGVRVYAVEDLYVPPPGNGGLIKPNQYTNQYGTLREAVFANKLHAYSLRRGKLLWEITAHTDQDTKEGAPRKDDNDESYFLGPPLPLDGRLYVLTQHNENLRLLCLDPERGEVNWVQLLATTQNKLSQDVNRRVKAANLAYGEGVLVCPTNAGMLLGIDLLSHSIVWAHPYHEKGQAVLPNQVGPGMIMRPGMVMPNRGFTPPEWKVTAPVVQDGRVVFTAPDGTSVRCLNLRDGSLAWKANRTDDDLYLAGVVRGKVLIVGKKDCRALSLADGSKLWELPTGVPSGQGVFSGHLYYLPLKDGRNHEPEVCVLDVDKGKDVSHTRSRKKEVPGNLVLYEGRVLSQTVDEVAAFPQLDAQKKQMTARIARNPNDPVGRVQRGELSLDGGDLVGAIDDFRAALKNDPPPEIRAKARAQLYDALTDYLRDNFDAAEKYLGDYREVCKVEVAPEASDEEKKQAEEEQRRRTGNYLGLVARGREGQGRLTEAFQNYLDFAEQANKKELVSVPDEPAVRAPANVWAHGRISAMMPRATPEQRQAVEGLVTKRWQELERAADTEGLRRFVTLFGSEYRVGREARFALAEQLAKEPGKDTLPEAERQFLLLARQPDDRQLAARALDALAGLMQRHGLPEDAVHYYRMLGRDFADVRVRDGKTGADLLHDLVTDKRFLPYLEERGQAFGGSKVDLQSQGGQFLPTHVLFQFEPDGDVLPFFQRSQVGLDSNTHVFRLVDRATNETRWETKVTTTQFFATFLQQGQVLNGQAPRYTYHTVGHVIVLPVGHMVFGLDPINKRVLWEQSLLGSPGFGAGTTNPSQVIPDPKDGSLQVIYPDGWIQRIPPTGPVGPSAVCLQTHDGLRALDPITGQTLWMRSDVRPRAHVFGDDRHVYLVDLNAEGNPSGTRAFRAADGVTVKDVPDFGVIYNDRQRVDGSRIFASEARDQKLVVRLYDVPTGKDVWKKECAAGSLLVQCEEPHEGGVLESDGSLTVLDLRSAREVLKTHIDAKDVEKVQGVSLVRDRTQYYLLINGQRDVNVNPWGPMPNFMPGTGYRSLPINGRVYAFDAATGKVHWATLEIPSQMLVLEQFRELPILLMTSRFNRFANGRFGGVSTNGAVLTVLDKRTGKFLKDEHDLPNTQQQFHTFRADLREGKIELISFQYKVTLTLGAQEAPKPPRR